jgi:hypothetical protein
MGDYYGGFYSENDGLMNIKRWMVHVMPALRLIVITLLVQKASTHCVIFMFEK